jgi:hypothetical protein
MPVVTKKLRTDEEMVTVKLRVHRSNEARIKAYVKAVESADDRIWSVAEVFPEYAGKEEQIALRAYRHREGLTQVQLSALTGIPQHHLSEMENGKRGIGKIRARVLAKALGVSDYRLFL